MFYVILQQIAWTAATAVFIAFCGMCVVGMLKVIIEVLNDLDRGE